MGEDDEYERVLVPPMEQLDELEAKEPIDILRDQVEVLLVSADAVARQLYQHGDHQSSVIGGHNGQSCRTCVVGREYGEAANKTREVFGELFPPEESAESAE